MNGGPAYRIEYSIQRADDWQGEFVEVGFGSSGGCESPDAAAYAISADIANKLWETSGDMPDPETLLLGDLS